MKLYRYEIYFEAEDTLFMQRFLEREVFKKEFEDLSVFVKKEVLEQVHYRITRNPDENEGE